MDVWPTSLQQLLNSDDFTESLGDNTIRSTNDVGPDKVRSRMTKRVDLIQCSIFVDRSQYDTLVDFYATILGNGVLPFNMNHPITGDLSIMRFKQPPQFKPLGGIEFSVAMVFEILPQ